MQPQAKIKIIVKFLLLLFPFLGFVCFKLFFPFPNFSPDSITYIDAAIQNDSLTLWPIGYSKFLQLIHSITKKDIFLTCIQYLLLEISIAFLILSIHSFFKINKILLIGLFLILSINPLIFHLSNFIGSDAVFTAISIIWSTHLLWSLKNPFSTIQLIVHSIIVFIAFTFRYNAIYYPIFSVAILLWRRNQIKQKLLGISIILIPVILFSINNILLYHKQVGIGMLNAFGGWQMASNALNAYSHSIKIKPEEVPNRFRRLHELTNQHFDSLNQLKIRPDTLIGTYYLWENKAPLRQYIILKHKVDNPSKPLTFKEWAIVSPLYFSYGIWVIKRNPLQFINYFLLPNFKYYFIPPPEYLQIYNMQKDSVDPIIQSWFNYPNNKIHPVIRRGFIPYIPIFQVIAGIINLMYIVSLLGWIIMDGYKLCAPFFRIALLLATLILVSNFIFSISASAIVLRYQVFPLIISVTFEVIIINSIFQTALFPTSTIQTQYSSKKN